ncbi:hypothetical protein [Methylobacterium phyllostachyos]|nr:hypothetical protein [Methylobacterium phyllostachyos]
MAEVSPTHGSHEGAAQETMRPARGQGQTAVHVAAGAAVMDAHAVGQPIGHDRQERWQPPYRAEPHQTADPGLNRLREGMPA